VLDKQTRNHRKCANEHNHKYTQTQTHINPQHCLEKLPRGEATRTKAKDVTARCFKCVVASTDRSAHSVKVMFRDCKQQQQLTADKHDNNTSTGRTQSQQSKRSARSTCDNQKHWPHQNMSKGPICASTITYHAELRGIQSTPRPTSLTQILAQTSRT
jgi:hypothetical protein